MRVFKITVLVPEDEGLKYSGWSGYELRDFIVKLLRVYFPGVREPKDAGMYGSENEDDADASAA